MFHMSSRTSARFPVYSASSTIALASVTSAQSWMCLCGCIVKLVYNLFLHFWYVWDAYLLHCLILFYIYESFVDYEVVMRFLSSPDLLGKLVCVISLLNRFSHFVTEMGAHHVKRGVVNLLLSDSYRTTLPPQLHIFK